MISFFKMIVYTPIYNGLVFLIDTLPGGNVALAVILITIIVKLVLFPISMRAYRTQIAIKSFNNEINELKNKFKNDKNKQAEAIMNFYKEKKINPFASILVLLIQIPVIFSLYYIFARGGFPSLHSELIYSFVPTPEIVNTTFIGMFDLAEKSVFFAALVGITQFFQMKIAMPNLPQKKGKMGESFKDDMARGMQFQMRYIMPLFITFIAYNISLAVSLYWITSNAFAIGQELYLRKKFSKNRDTEVDNSNNITNKNNEQIREG